METIIENSSEIIVSGLTSPSIEIDQSTLVRRNLYIERSCELIRVENQDEQKYAIEIMGQLKSFEKGMELSREMVKRPVIEIGRKIDLLAKDTVQKVKDEYQRLGKLVSFFQQKQIEEQDRIKREEEQKRIKALQESEKIQSALDFKAASAKTAVAKLKILQEQEEVQKKIEAKIVQSIKTENESAPTRAAGMVVTKKWKFEVTDIKALHTSKPDLIILEPNNMAIRGMISGGMRECPGLRIYEDITTGVRT